MDKVKIENYLRRKDYTKLAIEYRYSTDDPEGFVIALEKNYLETNPMLHTLLLYAIHSVTSKEITKMRELMDKGMKFTEAFEESGHDYTSSISNILTKRAKGEIDIASDLKWDKSKIDLIRLLVSLSDMHAFGAVTETKILNSFGSFLGIDLSKYSQNLSHSLNIGTIETNTEFFDKLKQKMKKKYLKKN